MQNEGWIKIHRKFTEWGWYGDINTKTVFLHLLLTANYEAKEWQGRTIERGQVVIGRKELGGVLNLSEQNVRTALDKLERTGEITRKPTNKFTIVTICKFDIYQQDNRLSQPTTNQQVTNNQPTTNHNIRNKEIKNKRNKEHSSCILPNGRQQQQPTLEEINIEIIKKRYIVDAVQFYAYYEANGWMLKNNVPMKNWKAALYSWNKKEVKEAQPEQAKVSAEVHDITNSHLKKYDPSPTAINYEEYLKRKNND